MTEALIAIGIMIVGTPIAMVAGAMLAEKLCDWWEDRKR